MIVSVKLSKKQVAQILRGDFGNDTTTGPFIARGCRCVACRVLRAILKVVKKESRKDRK